MTVTDCGVLFDRAGLVLYNDRIALVGCLPCVLGCPSFETQWEV